MTCTLSVRVVKLGGKDCNFQGEKVCNGAVTKEIGTKLVKICSDGKIKTKTRKSVGEGYPLVGRDTGPGKGEILLSSWSRIATFNRQNSPNQNLVHAMLRAREQPPR